MVVVLWSRIWPLDEELGRPPDDVGLAQDEERAGPLARGVGGGAQTPWASPHRDRGGERPVRLVVARRARLLARPARLLSSR